MLWISRRRLQKLIDFERVKESIRDAERRTSGEIRVSIAPFFWGSAEKAAERTFDRLGMTRTRDRNGVLIFIVPSRRAFVVLGDRGIHERCGQPLWDRVVGVMSPLFRRGEFTEGLLVGIGAIAGELASHFPRDDAADQNELSDDVDAQ